MNRSEFIVGRLMEVYLDGRWIANTNYKEQLLATTWQQATQRVGELNSIALLTYHINYYLQGLLQVLGGGALEIKDKYSFDMLPVKEEKDWQALIAAFFSNAEKFIAAVAQLPDEKMDDFFVDPKYGTWHRNLEAVVEHSYYHLGQISLIRKLLTSLSAVANPDGGIPSSEACPTFRRG